MGSNNKEQSSGNDPRGRVQNEVNYQKNRYENQQGPMVNAMAYNYGRGSEADYGNYTDIMNMYRGIATGGGSSSGEGGGGGGGGGGYSAATWNPELIGYKDPFNSYAGFRDFSTTGGYSKDDIMNMRARGTSPVRAAYANAEREVNRLRSLQGGYSPNAFALQGRMAREQSQMGADAMQNVEAGLAEARNTGRLSGLAGMSDIEKQRLAADLEVSKYNADAKMKAAASNAGAANSAAASNASNAAYSAAASRADQLRALQGMSSLYGTTPGMTNMFGNQLISAVGQGGSFGNNMVGNVAGGEQLPGAWDQTIDRAQDIANLAGQVAYPWLPDGNTKQPEQPPIVGTNPGYGNVPEPPKQPIVGYNPGYGKIPSVRR